MATTAPARRRRHLLRTPRPLPRPPPPPALPGPMARRANAGLHRRREAPAAQGQRQDQGGRRWTSSATCIPSSTPVSPPNPATPTTPLRQAAEDWLAHGLDGRSPKTITKNQNVLEPLLKVIGARKLRDLTAADVRQALAAMAAGYSTAAVSMGHLALKRAHPARRSQRPRQPQRRDPGRHPQGPARTAVQIPDPGPGPGGHHRRGDPAGNGTAARPQRCPPPGGADARLHRAGLLCGLRTEEARALRWAHVDLDGDPAARPPVPPHVAVWRSVRVPRRDQDRTVAPHPRPPPVAVDRAARLGRQTGERFAAAADGSDWQDTGLVFTSHHGAALDAGNVRRMFKRICTEAGAGDAGPHASCAPPSSA